jgi:cytoskeletal protein RodZ
MITLLVLLAIALVAFVALTMLVIGLFEASWLVLLLILLIGLASIQILSMQRLSITGATLDENEQSESSPVKESPSLTSSKESEPDHIYRGVHYTQDTQECATPPSNATPNVVHGTYRGRPWQHPSTQQPNTPKPTELTYRGIKIPPKTQESNQDKDQQKDA